MKVRDALLLMLVGAVAGTAVTLLFLDNDRGQVPRTPSRDTGRPGDAFQEAYEAIKREGVDDHGPANPAKPEPAKDASEEWRDLKAEMAKARTQIDGMFQRGEGQAVLDLLDKLVALGPIAWPLVTELWVRIDADLWGDKKLGYSEWVEIAGHLESPAMTEVFVWSLTHAAPGRFVEGAVYRLPWVQDLKKTVSQFAELLKKTDEPCVVVALVRGLRKLENAAARGALLAEVMDNRRKPRTRATIAVHLGYQESAWAKPLLEVIARSDPDGQVRAAAAAALIAFDPPATGVLVAAIEPGAVPSGLRPGDIILRYGGLRTTKRMHLGQEINRRGAEPDPIEVELVREGRRIRLHVPAGRLGLITREVRAKE